MNNARAITLFYKVPAGIAQASFCFERAALACAREEGRTEFVIAIGGRILHWEGVSNPQVFING
jgi:hypothetical protein